MAGSSRSSKGRRGRGRSRKRRPQGGAPAQGAPAPGASAPNAPGAHAEAQVRERAPAAGPPGGARNRTRTRPRARAGARAGAAGEDDGFRAPLSVGPRPRAPWHPWPLSELLILVGAIGTIVGMTRLSHGGIANGGPVLFAGLAAVALGTFETAWREHSAGYRSHTLLLALLPVVVFHSSIALGLAAVTTVPTLLDVGLLAVDAAIFLALFKALRSRFQDARARVVSRL